MEPPFVWETRRSISGPCDLDTAVEIACGEQAIPIVLELVFTVRDDDVELCKHSSGGPMKFLQVVERPRVSDPLLPELCRQLVDDRGLLATAQAGLQARAAAATATAEPLHDFTVLFPGKVKEVSAGAFQREAAHAEAETLRLPASRADIRVHALICRLGWRSGRTESWKLC